MSEAQSQWKVGTGHEFFESWARRYASRSESEQAELRTEMRADAERENRPDFPFMAGVRLSEMGRRDLAEPIQRIALDFPWARAGALFELSVMAWLRHDVRESVRLLRQMETEGPLNAYQHREFAHRLIMIGEVAEAERHLEAALALEPESLRECLAYRQLADFMGRVSEEEAMARCERLKQSFPYLTEQQVADQVAAAVRDGRPYSLIRLNDGEGSLMQLGVGDEALYSDLYWKMRREFHLAYWFGDDSKLMDPDWLRVAQSLNAVILNADCLAAYSPHCVHTSYQYASVRNIPACFNVVRKLEQIASTPGFQPGRITLADSLVNQDMRRSGALARLLAEQTRLGLVSWNAALPEVLARRFDLEEVAFHQTPGEARVVPGAGDAPLAESYRKLTDELSQARPGMLYLVAGGIRGKVYCDLIKRAGGIALDVGAVVDIWMGTSGDKYFEDLSGHALI